MWPKWWAFTGQLRKQKSPINVGLAAPNISSGPFWKSWGLVPDPFGQVPHHEKRTILRTLLSGSKDMLQRLAARMQKRPEILYIA